MEHMGTGQLSNFFFVFVFGQAYATFLSPQQTTQYWSINTKL